MEKDTAKHYIIENTNLMAEWDWDKNNEMGLNPEVLTSGSSKTAWWKCKNGHEWQAKITDRSQGCGCPFCSGKKVLVGFNDLATMNRILASEWHPIKNGDLLPTMFSLGSHKKVWWLCKNGHEWQAPIKDRNKGNGCPYCSGRFAIKGENDLQTVNPNLAQEWNCEKNNGLAPIDVLPNSNKIVWWKCRKGHEWKSSVANRTKGNGCPYCAGKKITKGYNDLQTVNPDLASEWNYKKNNGLTPKDVLRNSKKRVWWICKKCGYEWESRIVNRTKGHGCPQCAKQRVIGGETDLRTVNPTLAQEWNYEKNGNLRPEDFTAKSGQKVWWKCSKGHEWQATIYNRNRRGCPICNSERNTSFPEYALVYYLSRYSLDVIHSYKENGYELDVYIPSKKIAIEYDGGFYHKNRIKNDLEKNSKCKRDGIKLYRLRENLLPLNDSSIDYIVQKDQKNLSEMLEEVLSEIIGLRVDINLERDHIAIENLREYTEKEKSLLFTNPQISQEWHYEKNGKLKPEHFSASSNKKVWWKCSEGHEWQATISDRSRGRGCPFCSGRKVLVGFNDLLSQNPLLAADWNYEKNVGLTPIGVLPNSNKKVWWKCSKGHEWQARIQDRNRGDGCPYCSGRNVISGINDFATLYPNIAAEWNITKNGDLLPTMVSPMSDKKVWWKCSKGHEWQTTVGHRSSGTNCPYCSGRYIIKGENDLQTVNPNLAQEWNYKKNGELTPSDVLPNSNKKVWWKCGKGHEWQAVISSRNNGRRCPYCSGRYIMKGENDLQTVNPKLAQEWNYKKNGELTPSDVMPNSDKTVWWLCKNGHEWQAKIGSRHRGTGCPQCYKEKRKKKIL